jgi:hypothetical protein
VTVTKLAMRFIRGATKNLSVGSELIRTDSNYYYFFIFCCLSHSVREEVDRLLIFLCGTLADDSERFSRDLSSVN